jgi:hypothetical protein
MEADDAKPALSLLFQFVRDVSLLQVVFFQRICGRNRCEADHNPFVHQVPLKRIVISDKQMKPDKPTCNESQTTKPSSIGIATRFTPKLMMLSR